MSGTEQFEKLRSVGGLEKYSTARHHLKFYYNAEVAANYILPESFALPVKDYVYRACETLIGQHPALAAIPVGEDTKKPYFVRLPQIDLDQAVSFQDRTRGFPGEDEEDQELEALLKAQHNTGFTPPYPHWRLCILTDTANKRQFTAAYTFHHAISDGGSGMAFHRAFLQALQNSASLASGEVKHIILPPEMPLLSSIEEVHPLPLSLWYIATAIFRAKIWSPRDPGLWTGSKIASPLETDFRHFVCSRSMTSSFKDLCRQNDTTITATLQTIIARSLFAHLPERYTQLQCVGAISTRRWLSGIITVDSLGCWVQDYKDTHNRHESTQDSFPWSEAKRARETIEKVLNLQGRDASLSLLKYVEDIQEELFLSKLGKERDSSFELSNIGAMRSNHPHDPSMPQMGRMVFSQSANITGSAIEISAVTGADGCLVLCFTWQKGVVEESLISLVVQTAKAELQGLCTDK
ncbi:uncharacterized protein ATNIH1004_010171 [Aspergillus tanneri]|uniref:Alcohol acetyltransferase n=1 Tax=Aspergillus tanneri TaxID=1220188 RepID=A0A5M9M8M4_9EURO|nr:uncharacterized protein ATNIH1004_010171 [Aspergillus tanneri]KAA8643402.1 hypothetical protein ATNIH1004_010171 [Aspergillus tanneri]